MINLTFNNGIGMVLANGANASEAKNRAGSQRAGAGIGVIAPKGASARVTGD